MLNKTRDEFRTKVPITVENILKYIKKTNEDNKYGYSYLLFIKKRLLNLDFKLLNIKNVI